MAENVGGIEYTVDINTSKLIDGERKATASMNKLGSTANKVAAAVTAAFAGITLAAFADKLVKVQRQFDILNAGLITATGSADNAAAAFETLQKFAATTPYSIDQAVTAFTRLTNLGLDPGIKSLTAYGNTASAMGKDLMQMVEAVADASTGEFERLKEFGIRASKEGDKVSLTFKGVTETVKFSAENIQNYLLKLADTNFAGAMDERAKTLDGAISNLSDSWDQLFLTISKSGVGEEIARGVRIATTAINELERSIEAGSLTSYFDEAVPYIDALKVAATSLAAVFAGRMVSAITASAGATIAATLAKREALAEAVRLTTAELAQAQAAARVATATAAMGGSSTAAAAAQARLTAATTAATAAQTAYASSATAAGIALRGWGTLLGAMGGWVGIAVTALSLLALNWDKVSGAAESAAKISENAADRIRRALSGASATPMRDLIDGMSKAQKDLAEIDKQLASGMKYTTTVGPRAFEEQRKMTKEEIASLTERREALRGAVIDYQKARDDLKASQIAGLFPDKPPEPNKPAGGGGTATTKGPKFDSQGYINDLVIANADGLAKIDAQERAKQADNDRLLAEGKIKYAEYQQAQVLIAAAAEKDRADLRAKEKADTDQWLKEMYAIGEQASKDAAARAAQSRQAGEDIQRLGMTPEQQAQFDIVTQARDQLEELDALRQQNIITQEQYAQAEIDINRRKVEEIRALEMDSQHARLQAASSFFGEAASLLENYGDNSSNTYKNLFRISKAFALADSLVSLQAAIMKASVSAPFPANLGTMAAMGSAGLAVISNLRGVTFGGGRQYGGAVSADSLYRVNETGAPEMFTASNGRQYMMPNTKGEVTPANKLGGGVTINITNTMADATVSATQSQDGSVEITVQRAVAEVASQIASNNGQVWSALKGATSIQSKL